MLRKKSLFEKEPQKDELLFEDDEELDRYIYEHNNKVEVKDEKEKARLRIG